MLALDPPLHGRFSDGLGLPCLFLDKESDLLKDRPRTLLLAQKEAELMNSQASNG